MADRKETILIQLELDVNKLTANLQKTIEDFTVLSGRQKDVKKQLDELRSSGETYGATFANLSKEYAENKVRLGELRIEQSNYEKQLRLINTANKEGEGSIKALRAQLALATIEYNKISESERETSDRGKLLTASIKEISDKLKEQEKAVGDTRRNVGNYEEALQSLLKTFDQAASGVDGIQNAIDQLNQQYADGKTDQATYTEQLDKLTGELSKSTDEMNKLSGEIETLKNSVDAAGEPFKSLKQRIAEATNEATILGDKFKAGLIDEATLVSAQAKVAELKDELGDFNKRVEALDPGAKFKAFTQVAAGIAGGLASAQGAMALFGAESEDTQKALLKVQGALAFAQGLSQLAELGKSFNNLKLVLGFTTVATKVQTAAQVENTVAKEGAAVVTEVLAGAETQATVATKGLTVATQWLTGPLILIAVGIAAVVEGFKIYDAVVKQVGEDTDNLIDSATREIEASKFASEIRLQAIERDKENRQQQLDLAASQMKSEADLLQQKKQNAAFTQNLQDDLLDENARAIATLTDRQERLAENSTKAADEDERKKIETTQSAVKAQIEILKKANEQILDDQKKQDNDLEIEANNRREKLKTIAEETAQLNIALIQDARTREIETVRETLAERLRLLEQNEKDNAEKILATRAEAAQKIRDITFKYDLQEVNERNQLQINSTEQGSLARLDAEAAAAIALRNQRIKDTTLTVNQIAIIEQDAQNKLIGIDRERLDLIEKNNQQEVDLFLRKALAENEIQKNLNVGNDQAQLALALQEIEINTQAKIDAKESEADKLKEAAQREITDADELKARIIEIDKTTAAEKLAILEQSVTDIADVTAQAEERRLAIIVEAKQLALDAADPQGELLAQIDLLNAQEQAEIESARNKLGATEAYEIAKTNIAKKYAKLRVQLEEQAGNQEIAALGQTFGIAKGLLKKNSSEYRAFASAEAIISTYLAATKALASSPPPANYVLMAATIVAGLAQVAKINSADDGFYEGGFTGTGNPRSVSTTLGPRPYTYHKNEYIVPAKILDTPAGQFHVERLEQMRQNISTLHGKKYTSTISTPKSFEVGGFSDSIVVNNSTAALSIDDLVSAFDNSLAKMPRQVLVVEDVTGLQQQQVTVAARADS